MSKPAHPMSRRGGRYRRNADGSLTTLQEPTADRPCECQEAAAPEAKPEYFEAGGYSIETEADGGSPLPELPAEAYPADSAPLSVEPAAPRGKSRKRKE